MKAETGSASVLLAVILSAVLMAAGMVFAVARVAVVRAQASSAADLAALAAARDGDCSKAARVAADNQVTLDSCTVDGADVVVFVQAESEILPGRSVLVSASARAGPA